MPYEVNVAYFVCCDRGKKYFCYYFFFINGNVYNFFYNEVMTGKCLEKRSPTEDTHAEIIYIFMKTEACICGLLLTSDFGEL